MRRAVAFLAFSVADASSFPNPSRVAHVKWPTFVLAFFNQLGRSSALLDGLLVPAQCSVGSDSTPIRPSRCCDAKGGQHAVELERAYDRELQLQYVLPMLVRGSGLYGDG